jgi:hypothetical protein
MGDQDSDLLGGYAERTFKLPNTVYLALSRRGWTVSLRRYPGRRSVHAKWGQRRPALASPGAAAAEQRFVNRSRRVAETRGGYWRELSCRGSPEVGNTTRMMWLAAASMSATSGTGTSHATTSKWHSVPKAVPSGRRSSTPQ